MRFAVKFVSFSIALIFFYASNNAMAGCVVGINPDGSTAPCLDGGGSGGGTGGGYSPPAPRPFRGQNQQEKQQRHDRSAEKNFKPLLNQYYQQSKKDYQKNLNRRSAHLAEQNRRFEEATFNNEMGNNWNEEGITAYQSRKYAQAVQYFRHAKRYQPQDQDIKDNFLKSLMATYNDSENILKSVGTALKIKSISSHLMLFHPAPGVRMEAQKKLAKASMEAIVEAGTGLVISVHLSRGKVVPFSWETPEQVALRRELAKKHVQWVRQLQKEAYGEIPEEVNRAFHDKPTTAGGPIRIKTGPATKQLLNLGFGGFD